MSSSSVTHLTVIGWIVFLLILYGVNKTTYGHQLIYYGLVLILIFLFVGNYNRILPILTKQN